MLYARQCLEYADNFDASRCHVNGQENHANDRH